MSRTFQRQQSGPVSARVESLVPEFQSKVSCLSAIPQKALLLLFHNCGDSIVSLYDTVTDPSFRVEMLRGCGKNSWGEVTDFLRLFLARIEYVSDLAVASDGHNKSSISYDGETIYTTRVEDVGILEGNEVYEVSGGGISTQVKKYIGQHDGHCEYIARFETAEGSIGISIVYYLRNYGVMIAYIDGQNKAETDKTIFDDI